MPISSQGDTFTLFPLLPKELRVQIWNHALSPRVIPFHRDRDQGRFAGTRPAKFMALTTFNPSLEIIPRVCAESLAIFQKKYMEWDVWDVRKGVSVTKIDPDQDVVYFSHGFAGNIDHKLLGEFASQYPIQTKRIKTLALPAILSSDAISGVEILKSLRLFPCVNKLIIVLGHTYGPGLQGGDPVLDFSRSMLWGERSESGRGVWNLPDGAQDALETLKREQWPDWKIPEVVIAKFLDDVLSV